MSENEENYKFSTCEGCLVGVEVKFQQGKKNQLNPSTMSYENTYEIPLEIYGENCQIPNLIPPLSPMCVRQFEFFSFRFPHLTRRALNECRIGSFARVYWLTEVCRCRPISGVVGVWGLANDDEEQLQDMRNSKVLYKLLLLFSPKICTTSADADFPAFILCAWIMRNLARGVKALSLEGRSGRGCVWDGIMLADFFSCKSTFSHKSLAAGKLIILILFLFACK